MIDGIKGDRKTWKYGPKIQRSCSRTEDIISDDNCDVKTLN